MRKLSDTTLINFIQNYKVKVSPNSEQDMFIATVYNQSSMASTFRVAVESLYYVIEEPMNGEN